LGGWLFLPAIGLILGPIAVARTILEDVQVLGQLSGYPALSFALNAEIIMYAALGLLNIFVAIDFFRRRHRARAGYIWLLVASAAVAFTDLMLILIAGVSLSPAELGPTIGVAVTAIVWSAYFLRSKRVLRTFVAP
jgi:hypothetical protein